MRSAQPKSADGTVLSAGCDWITGVTLDVKSSWWLALLGTEMLTTAMRQGNVRRGWGLAGYSGFQCGPVQVGKRNDECIIRLSSNAAYLSWREVYKRADKITRFDLQVTHINEREPRRRIMDHYKQALRWSKKQRKAPAVSLILNSEKADTLYLGKRQSNRFGRIYAAGRQKKWSNNEWAIRYEVELKDTQAMLHARRMATAGSDPEGALDYSAAFFRNRGCTPPYGRSACTLLSDPPSVSDVHKRLTWLRNAVSPSIAFLLEKGHHDELLKALGVVIHDGRLDHKCGPT